MELRARAKGRRELERDAHGALVLLAERAIELEHDLDAGGSRAAPFEPRGEPFAQRAEHEEERFVVLDAVFELGALFEDDLGRKPHDGRRVVAFEDGADAREEIRVVEARRERAAWERAQV